MELIDGKKIAAKLLENIKAEVGNLGYKPLVVDLLVGEDPVSVSYVKIKGKTAQKAGMDFELVQVEASISKEDLLEEIRKINSQKNLCGLIIQLPLPSHLPKEEILDSMDTRADIDCLGRKCRSEFYAGRAKKVPPTAAAILRILEELKLDLRDKKVLVVGQGSLVGKPVSFLLRQQGLDMIVADRSTPDLKALTMQADVIIAGTGRPGLINGSMVKSGAVIIDAGTSEEEGSIVGDVDITSMEGLEVTVSPVPGGVGPVTVAKLLENAMKVARERP